MSLKNNQNHNIRFLPSQKGRLVIVVMKYIFNSERKYKNGIKHYFCKNCKSTDLCLCGINLDINNKLIDYRDDYTHISDKDYIKDLIF